MNNWLLSNRIKINRNKSNFIVYSHRKNIIILPIKMVDNFIIQTNSSKFLGITIDKHFNFGEYINNISLKLDIFEEILLICFSKFKGFSIVIP